MANLKEEGTLDQVSEKGVVLGGKRLAYSKWFEGERLTEASLGSRLSVMVDVGEKCSFLKRVLEIGEKVPGWNPPPANRTSAGPNGSWGGQGGRRLSPEELDLKRAEGVRIARCCAVERAVDMAERGIAVEAIASHARALEEYFLSGNFTPEAEPRQAQPGQAESRRAEPRQAEPRRAPVAERVKEPKEVLPPLPRPESKVQEVSPEVVRTPKSSGKPELPPPPARPKPSLGKRLESRAVNALFNEAKQSGLVAGWQDYERLIRKVLGGEVKSPYHLSPEEWARFESWVRPRQKAAKVA